ncbi:MAG: cysteine hydrolase [Rickettsiales bacterium]|nr:cysteine hydrolase [Rickettsiales bacterium]
MEFGLILIDIQKGLDELDYYGGQRNNPEAETNCKALLEAFRGYNYPCIFIQHDSTNPASPLFPNKPGHELKKEITPLPDEPVFHKNVNSAFIGTSLEEWIKEREIKKVVMAGLTTEHCISTSVRMCANLGFNTILIEDATAAFQKTLPNGNIIDAELVHQVELAILRDEFAEIINTKEMLSRLKH